MFVRRNIEEKLEATLQRSPVTLLTGARQTGKTTLIKELGKKREYTYVTFDDLSVLLAAKKAPIDFIKGLPKPVIIDEVQRLPEIFLPIKQDVDENRTPGRYLLTGSANPLLIPRLGDSLAGRMEILTLYPLSQGELSGVKETFIDNIFENKIPRHAQPLTKPELYNKILIGGYPPVQQYDEEARDSWFRSYVTTILYRDVQELAQVTGLIEFPKLLQLLATRSGGLLNTADVARSAGMNVSTLRRYMSLLEILYMIQLVPAWSSNLGKRLSKSEKCYLIDSGLLSNLVAATSERILADAQLAGSSLENFIISELIKQATWSKKSAEIYHFRTLNDVEVDVVLEDRAGSLVGIEIKARQTITAKDFKGLEYLQELMGAKFISGIVLYTGNQTIPFGNNLWAVPVSSLWSKENPLSK